MRNPGGEALEFGDDRGRETCVARELPDGFRVVLEAIATPCGQLRCDVDDELAHGEEGEIALERGAGHARAQRMQMDEMPSQLREAIDDRTHSGAEPRIAASFLARMRCSHGSRSAARSWTLRT